MPEGWLADTRRSYDTDAAGYAEQVEGLLDGHPYLRGCLSLFAESVRRAGGGPVADVGCGPGYVTGHLHDLGVEAFGIDLSPEMGTMTDLDLGTGSVGGLVAFWSVVHVPDHAVPGVFAEFRRVLRPGGPLLVGFHVGDEVHHASEGYSGSPVALDTHRRQPAQVESLLRDAGFTIEATLVLRPYDDTPGAVVFATPRA
jgi:SAM-dependent methyltransferase